ncbi:peptidoglycan-binding domain-containing protein [Actinoplanes italicus]|uniref:Peptidoglycan hydrolase-like protein with peptidoglycan-binding domain n=1 Tax=Actinoplanes italicus TaxID=113567 RepID=A0A2T0K0K7_9ACTN|nr:peptidoglycan-binding domain-containing protein [Actinoplanes italicus]PRX16308.1 peptidoglycan hydrolase-like protein with peptidoglycan-binding domain [Actinoplanes italicus]
MRAGLPVLVFTVTLAVTGCGDGDTRVRVAEHRVASKQEALTQARAELAGRIDGFCRSSSSYVTALDRYGDLITDTAVTVGDVKEAGSDLAEPRSDVVTATEQVTAAREDVATAERELAEANAALAAARGGVSAVPPVSASPRTPVAGTTVDRVKQADADLTAAREGITDQTPLKQASERFNSAAVALEMAWLRLLGEAGCLSEDQQRRARDYTLAMQRSLTEAGYLKSETDGVYGPDTVAAVQALQKAHGLAETGTVDKATDAALRAKLRAEGGAAAGEAVVATSAVQQTLKLAGFWDGPVDGMWTDELTTALRSFQAELGVEPTGTVDAATVAAVGDVMDQRSTAPSAVPSRS